METKTHKIKFGEYDLTIIEDPNLPATRGYFRFDNTRASVPDFRPLCSIEPEQLAEMTYQICKAQKDPDFGKYFMDCLSDFFCPKCGRFLVDATRCQCHWND